jgi:hypothetical protein
MRASLTSSFLKYDLTQGEFEGGCRFSSDQRAVIQNLIADCAEEKIALTFDVNNPQVFVQAEAELQGKIGILKYLLSLESQLPPEVN